MSANETRTSNINDIINICNHTKVPFYKQAYLDPVSKRVESRPLISHLQYIKPSPMVNPRG